MDQELRKIERRKMRNVILIILCCLILGAAGFAYFAMSVQSRNILRESKNVQIAFQMLSIEYYAQGKSIYTTRSRSGMAAGVEDRIVELSGERGNIMILSYDNKNREVTSFTYERNHYRVTYLKNDEGVARYDVEYLVPVLSYEK